MGGLPNDLQAREKFHTLLLAHRPAGYRAPTGKQSAPVGLKGGVNLRLLQASPRYSEDMDFAVTRERGAQFVNHLRKVLTENAPFREALLKQGIEDLKSAPSKAEGGTRTDSSRRCGCFEARWRFRPTSKAHTKGGRHLSAT